MFYVFSCGYNLRHEFNTFYLINVLSVGETVKIEGQRAKLQLLSISDIFVSCTTPSNTPIDICIFPLILSLVRVFVSYSLFVQKHRVLNKQIFPLFEGISYWCHTITPTYIIDAALLSCEIIGANA